jgi:hypothetical protein
LHPVGTGLDKSLQELLAYVEFGGDSSMRLARIGVGPMVGRSGLHLVTAIACAMAARAGHFEPAEPLN